MDYIKEQALKDLDQHLREWIQTPSGRRTFLLSIPFLLTSCATSSNHRMREGDNTGQNTSLTVADERRMTQEILPKMKKDYPPVNDPELQRYISTLGQKIVHRNNLNNQPYTYNFTAVDVNYVNAFALPAGTVFVTTPLIAMAETEAELAGVIGHEVGHVKARHSAERIDYAKKEQSKSWLYGLGGALVGGAAGFGLGKLLCKKRDKECLTRASVLGAAAGAGGGLLIQKYAFMANSREDEMEADRIGFKTSVGAGYDKNHVGTFYQKLLAMEEQAKRNNTSILAPFADAMSTHPPSRERVQQMHQMAAQTSGGSGLVSTKEFEKMRARAQELARKG